MAAVPSASDAPDVSIVRASFAMRLAVAAGVLVLLAGGISLCGRLIGHTVALAGYTDDAHLYEVVIGNNVIAAPANTIRQGRARHDGVAQRLDLYLRWPDMDGFSEAARADFNNADGAKRILFLTFEPKMMSRDMSGRLQPIYEALVEPEASQGPAGISFHAFTAKSGYLGEKLAVAERQGDEPFVARCLAGGDASASLAPCERDIQIGDDLSLTYRFPEELLAVWPRLEAAVRQKANSLLKTAG